MSEPTMVDVRFPGPKAEADRVRGLVERAQQGDSAVILELRKVLDQHPDLWQAAGDVARVSESAWLQRLAGEQLFFKESVTRYVRALRRDLLGAGQPGGPTALERLLVDRIICTWLGLQYAEAVHARTIKEQTFDQGVYYQERIVRYQRMHLAAIRALAQLRRVSITAIRIQAADGQHMEAARVDANGHQNA